MQANTQPEQSVPAPITSINAGSVGGESATSQERRFLIGGLIIIAITVVASLLFYLLEADSVIEAMYRGTAPFFLNRLIHDRSDVLSYYVTHGKLVFSHLFLILIFGELGLLAAIAHRTTRRIFRDFFAAATHPLNLAVFRIVVAWELFKTIVPSEILTFSRLPKALQFPPWGTTTILHFLPINQMLATISTVALVALCFLTLIGYFSRLSAFFCLLFGLYALGIPEFYGKVDHYHFLLWFMAILAVSPSGDFLSVDSLHKAGKRADAGVTEPPGPSRAYALPLRFVWLLLGILYFFPGFWKFWNGGLAWALSDNLKYQFYLKWHELHWVPGIRLDNHPTLYHLAGLGVILFEMSFLFCIFFPRLRIAAAFGGVLFHRMNGYFLRIGFGSLYWCYVAFFDWNAIFHFIGRHLYRRNLVLLYDGGSRMCRRIVAGLRVLDIFGRIKYVDRLEQQLLRECGIQQLKLEASHALHVLVDQRALGGILAAREVAKRIPLFWPAVPFLYLFQDLSWIADRLRKGEHLETHATVVSAPALRRFSLNSVQFTGVTLLGAVLILGNVYCGIHHQTEGWPFACFPTFMQLAGPQTKTLKMIPLSSSGEPIPMGKLDMGTERLRGMVGYVLRTRDASLQRSRLLALWKLWVKDQPRLRKAGSVEFFENTIWIKPERWGDPPIHRKLLLDLRL